MAQFVRAAQPFDIVLVEPQAFEVLECALESGRQKISARVRQRSGEQFERGDHAILSVRRDVPRDHGQLIEIGGQRRGGHVAVDCTIAEVMPEMQRLTVRPTSWSDVLAALYAESWNPALSRFRSPFAFR